MAESPGLDFIQYGTPSPHDHARLGLFFVLQPLTNYLFLAP